MSETSWKKLGKKQGANMKNYRNVRMDKAFYNNGKWDTFYTDDDIKRLAYYNVDLPHVVGIGTKTPFSKLSFGDSSDSGQHITTDTITPGKVTAIAMHEKSISKSLDGAANSSFVKGQDFAGFSYVNQIKSVRKRIDNDNSASGIALYANKSSEDTDTSLKTNKAVLYVTDDNYVHIGGVPKEFDLIDPRNPAILPGNSLSGQGVPVLTGPNILLDVSGSMHVNGFINFLRNGNSASRFNDNPSGQMTYDTVAGDIVYVNDASKNEITRRAVPDGAIWVGFNKRLGGDGNYSLENKSRLYIQYEGENTKVLTEKDSDLVQSMAGAGGGGGGTTGLTWSGDDDSASQNNPGAKSFYVFRNGSSEYPSGSLINTFVGRDDSGTDSYPAFVKVAANQTNTLPRLLKAPTGGEPTLATDSTPSALSIIGNLSVFDFTTGGTNGTLLSGTNNEVLAEFKRILQSDIYTNLTVTDNAAVGQRELGSIYTDRHIMVGGFQGDPDTLGNARFTSFSSAIDISGGIFRKPAIRVLTGSHYGSLVKSDNSNNCRDSLIIGNTDPDDFSGANTESIIIGEQAEIKGAQNSIVQGSSNTIRDISYSLVIGKNLEVGQTGTTMEGVVALGEGPVTINGNDRIVFATNDGTSSMKALTIDKNGNITTGKNLTIQGDMQVQGEKIILDVTHKIVSDSSIEHNAADATVGNNHATASAGTLTSQITNPALPDHEGGIKLYIHEAGDQTHFVQWTYDEENNIYSSTDVNTNNHIGHNQPQKGDRWTTALSSRAVGLAAVACDFTNTESVNSKSTGVPGSEQFKVLNNGDLEISDGTTANGGTLADGGKTSFKVTASSGNTEIEGTLVVKGETHIKNNFAVQNGTTDKFTVASSTGNTVIKGSLTVNDKLQVDNVKIDGNTISSTDTDGNITVAPNGNGTLKIDSGATITSTNVHKIIEINGGYGSGGANDNGATFDISKNNAGKTVTNLKITGKLHVDGLIDPTGLVLDDQSSFPNTDNGSKVTIWSHNGTLKFRKGSDPDDEIATKASVDAITSGGSGGTNVNSANKIKIQNKTDNSAYNLLFASSNGNSQEVYSESGVLTYNPSTNTLSAANFSGALSGNASTASNISFPNTTSSGFVKWDSTNGLSTETVPNANASTYGLVKLGTGGTSNSNRYYPVVTNNSGQLRVNVPWEENTNTQLSNENVQDIVGGMVNGTESGITVSYNDTGGNLDFSVDKDITLDNSADKVIKIADETTTGNGKQLTIQAGNGKNGNGGDLVLSGGLEDGNNTDGSIKMLNIPGAPADENGADELLSINFTGQITAGARDIIMINDSDRIISINDTEDNVNGRKLTIKAGSASANNKNGGDLDLLAGDKHGNGTNGDVNITGTNIDLNGTVKIGGTTITATATELNILDGDTIATQTTVADADRVILNDDGTMKQVTVTDLAAYFDDEITAMPNLTSVGTLSSLTVNGDITLNNGADRVIGIEDASSTNAGDKLTIKAGKGANGDNVNNFIIAENSNGKDGGDINITAGDGGDAGSYTGTGIPPSAESPGVQGDVNITGTNIELNGTVKSDNLNVRTGDFQESVITTNRTVIGRPMTKTYTSSVGNNTEFPATIAHLLMGRILIDANTASVTLPSATDMCGIKNLVDGEGFSCTFSNMNTANAKEINAKTGTNVGTTRFYGYDGVNTQNSFTGDLTTGNGYKTNGCKIRAVRSVVLHFVKINSNTIEVNWEGDNIIELS